MTIKLIRGEFEEERDFVLVIPKLFQPYRLLALDHLEKQLVDLLENDFAPAQP